MLALVAAAQDPGASILAGLLRDAGAEVEVVESFTGLVWDLTIADDSATSTTVRTAAGRPVGAVVLRSLPQDEDPFCRAEQSAAWWALLASFPGPVVGRPTRSGLTLTVDRLRLDRSPVWAGRWALRHPAAAGDDGHPGGCVRPGPDGTPSQYLDEAPASDDVVDLTPFTPGSTVRVIVAGRRTLVPRPTGPDLVGGRRREVGQAVARALGESSPALASVVLDLRDGYRVLDVGPVPTHLLGTGLGPTIAAGILEAVR